MVARVGGQALHVDGADRVDFKVCAELAVGYGCALGVGACGACARRDAGAVLEVVAAGGSAGVQLRFKARAVARHFRDPLAFDRRWAGFLGGVSVDHVFLGVGHVERFRAWAGRARVDRKARAVFARDRQAFQLGAA